MTQSTEALIAELMEDLDEAASMLRAFPTGQNQMTGKIHAPGSNILDSCADDIDRAKATITGLRAEVERTRFLITGGEDAPGHIMSLPFSDIERVARENQADLRARAESAEATVAELRAEVEEKLEAMKRWATAAGDKEREATKWIVHYRLRAEDAEAALVTHREALEKAREAFANMARKEDHRILSGSPGPLYTAGWNGGVAYSAEKTTAALTEHAWLVHGLTFAPPPPEPPGSGALHTMTLSLTDAEMAALEKMSEAQALKPQTIFRQALRVYQLYSLPDDHPDQLVRKPRTDFAAPSPTQPTGWAPDRERTRQKVIAALDIMTEPGARSVADIADAVLAVIPAGQSGWRSISEAPRDGTSVLLFVPETFLHCVGAFKINEWRSSLYGVKPTHFMPLPAPPAADGGV